MPYKNDVFISYKRGPLNEQWLEQIFLPLFKNYLNDLLPHEPEIFVDKKGLTPGVFFNDELFINLVQSKCIVSIWSQPYFRRSDWCVMEFLTMKHRQEALKLGPLTKPKALIWPVLYREVEPMPEIALGMSYNNYTDFNVVGDAFFKTEKYLLLQEKMEEDIKTVADIINYCPSFDSDWDTGEGIQKLKDELKSYFQNNKQDNDIKQEPITWEAKS